MDAYKSCLLEAANAYKRKEFEQTVALCKRIIGRSDPHTDALLLLGAAYYQTGDYVGCVAANDAAILIDPCCPEAHANLANSLQQLGSLDLALTYYTSAIRLKPDFIDAYVNLGACHMLRGDVVHAAQAYGTALALDPGMIQVRCILGDIWRREGGAGRATARQCFAAALEQNSNCVGAWRGLGDCARDDGDHERALTCYEKAIELCDTSTEAHTGRAMVLRELNRPKEAEASFLAVASLSPHCALAHANLAGSYYENGKLDSAIEAYTKALQLKPDFSEALNNLGNALRERGRPEEAVVFYVQCIQSQLTTLLQLQQQQQQQEGVLAPETPGLGLAFFKPTDSGTKRHKAIYKSTASATANATKPGTIAQRLSVSYNNLGGVLKILGRSQECISAYQHVVMLQPASPEGHTNLGSAYKDVGRHEDAMAAYSRALALRPDFPEAFANFVHSMQCVCDWRDREVLFERLEREVREDLARGKLPSVQPFHAMAYPFSASMALAISKRYAQECLKVAQRLLPSSWGSFSAFPHPVPTPLSGGTTRTSTSTTSTASQESASIDRLRVGYVSSDFVNHPLAHLMGSVFGLHDRTRIEVFSYALSPSDDSPWRQRIATESEHFTDVSTWTSTAIAQRISDDCIHILVNLNGYTKGARNEIFAMRPAPVQISVMGFPATMGAEYIQWIVLDKEVCPPQYRGCYSEAVAYLPNSYFVNDYRRSHPDVLRGDHTLLPTRESLGLPPHQVVYSCANQLYKYDPHIFDAWCRILHRVPDSVLWLLRFPASGEAFVRAEAIKRGVHPTRIIFTDVAPKPVHIARSGLADVFLDTPACNAHTTGCDVLWGGCPIVTLPGERMASRVAASLCRATGLGQQMVVGSVEEYEERAVELGLNHEMRGKLRDELRAMRETCALFDTGRWVADFDRALLRMWEIHCEGNGPRDFEV